MYMTMCAHHGNHYNSALWLCYHRPDVCVGEGGSLHDVAALFYMLPFSWGLVSTQIEQPWINKDKFPIK